MINRLCDHDVTYFGKNQNFRSLNQQKCHQALSYSYKISEFAENAIRIGYIVISGGKGALFGKSLLAKILTHYEKIDGHGENIILCLKIC